jgi:hypothetical protein
MTKHDSERVERLLNAELKHDPNVEERYTEASHACMAALEAHLRSVVENARGHNLAPARGSLG